MSKRCRRQMSASGYKRTFHGLATMSALGGKADIHLRNVSLSSRHLAQARLSWCASPLPFIRVVFLGSPRKCAGAPLYSPLRGTGQVMLRWMARPRGRWSAWRVPSKPNSIDNPTHRLRRLNVINRRPAGATHFPFPILFQFLCKEALSLRA